MTTSKTHTIKLRVNKRYRHNKDSSSRLAITDTAPQLIDDNLLSQLFTNFIKKLYSTPAIQNQIRDGLNINVTRHSCIMSVELVLNSKPSSIVLFERSQVNACQQH